MFKFHNRQWTTVKHEYFDDSYKTTSYFYDFGCTNDNERANHVCVAYQFLKKCLLTEFPIVDWR